LKKIRNGVVWVTGLSVSGKTTIGSGLHAELKLLGFNNIMFLDGEDLRRHASREYGYSIEERMASSLEDYKTLKKFTDDGYLTIISTISPQKEVRVMARDIFKDFIEVYLECPVDVCAQRDYKDQYRKAFTGEIKDFVGVTQEYQISNHPDIVLNTANDSIDHCLKLLVNFVCDKFEIKETIKCD
jgi:adenylylsulfate kinase